MNHQRAKACHCGARLRWEYRGYPSTWLATCESEMCGFITTPEGQAHGMPEFMATNTKPATPPWIRLFLGAPVVPVGDVTG